MQMITSPIRLRWTTVKGRIGEEVHRIKSLLRQVCDDRDGGSGDRIVSGQRVSTIRIVENLGVKGLVSLGGGDIGVEVNGKPMTYLSDCVTKELHREVAEKEHFHGTLQQADEILAGLRTITIEKCHHAVDAALLAQS